MSQVTGAYCQCAERRITTRTSGKISGC